MTSLLRETLADYLLTLPEDERYGLVEIMRDAQRNQQTVSEVLRAVKQATEEKLPMVGLKQLLTPRKNEIRANFSQIGQVLEKLIRQIDREGRVDDDA